MKRTTKILLKLKLEWFHYIVRMLKIRNWKKSSQKAYIEPYQEFEAKVNKVVKALNDTASVVAENVDVFVQKQKKLLEKNVKQLLIN